MNLFNYIYYHIYLTSKKANAVPEIPVLAFISFCQTNNLLTVFHLLLILLKFEFDYQIPKFYIVTQILLYLVNYYYYQTKGFGEILLNSKKYCLGKWKFLIYVYGGISVFLTGFTYYIYKEF